MRRCDGARAFAGDEGIVLCHEFAEALYLRLGDRERASDALLFALFHELAHVLLRQWEHPLFANEATADEFATAMLALVGESERAGAQAGYLEANPTLLEGLAAAFADDRHTLSVQRAREVRRWAHDPGLVERWQTIFLPNMQSAALERLRRTPPAWTTRALVERELRARGAPGEGR